MKKQIITVITLCTACTILLSSCNKVATKTNGNVSSSTTSSTTSSNSVSATKSTISSSKTPSSLPSISAGNTSSNVLALKTSWTNSETKTLLSKATKLLKESKSAAPEVYASKIVAEYDNWFIMDGAINGQSGDLDGHCYFHIVDGEMQLVLIGGGLTVGDLAHSGLPPELIAYSLGETLEQVTGSDEYKSAVSGMKN